LISYLGPESQNQGRHQEMWLLDTKTRQTELITAEGLDCTKPTWSPDSKHVAYFDRVGSGVAIRIWSLETKSTKVLTSDIERGELLPWSPDGQFIFARRTLKPSAQPASAEEKAEGAPKDGIVVYRSQENADKAATEVSKGVESSILALDVATGSEKTIVRRNKVSFFAVSPNGKFIAWCENERFFTKPEFYGLCDIGMVALGAGDGRIVARDFKDLFDVYGNGLAWSPDGNTLAIASVPMSLNLAGSFSNYYAIDASSGKIRQVYRSEHPQFDPASSFLLWVNAKQFVIKEGTLGRELWIVSTDGRKPYLVYQTSVGNIRGSVLGTSRWDVWHPRPSTLAIFVLRESDRKTVPVWVNYETRSASELPAMPRFSFPIIWWPHGADSSGDAVLELEDPTHPQDLWKMAADGSLEQLSDMNPGISRKKLGNVRLLEWQEKGEPKRAMLLLPTDYVEGKRYPTIVTQYAGIIMSRRLFSFGLQSVDGINQQLYGSRGYAVLVPDIYIPVPSGSEGEGLIASPRPNGLEEIARQINTAVDHAVKQGCVDPARLGITGTSEGGYGVMSTIVSTSRFNAAVARAPVVDEISQTWQFTNGKGEWGPLQESFLGASLWKDRELYISNSPFYFLDRVRTPLLLTSGTKDDTVSTQPQQAYIGMKQLGKDVTLVEYEGEGHIMGDWSYSHQRDLIERMLRFFDEHLGLSSTNAGAD
jgi:dipeptidyl aminopeptidase/acylaminoacyl peptidase